MKDLLPLSSNGRVSALILITFGYLIYYLFGFPYLIGIQKENFLIKKQWQQPYQNNGQLTGHECNLTIIISASKYLTDYQEGHLTLNIISQEPNKNCQGVILIAGSLVKNRKETPDDVVMFFDKESEKTSSHNVYLEYDLKPYSSMNIPLLVNIPTRDADEVQFSISQMEKMQDGSLTEKRELELDSRKDCKDENISKICSKINPLGVFSQGVLEKILLPPFLNGFLPILCFGIIWLSEISLAHSLKDTFNFVDMLKIFLFGFVICVMVSSGFILMLFSNRFFFLLGLVFWIASVIVVYVVSAMRCFGNLFKFTDKINKKVALSGSRHSRYKKHSYSGRNL